MATIRFNSIPTDEVDHLVEVFNFIARGKRDGNIDEKELAGLLKERHKTKFWWPTREEQEEWTKKWNSTPIEARHTDPSLKTPWEFGSWVDAFYNAEIELENITINEHGEG